jgi:aryl carrier-like protein
MPLTVNGKVDRKALPAPELQHAQYVAPESELEQALCEVWQQVLKREQVGVQENFFSLGGDSILAIRIIAGLKQQGYQLKVQDIFIHQTIRSIAKNLSVINEKMDTIDKQLTEKVLLATSDGLTKDEIEMEI